jgi:hypothetical protein
MPARGKKIPADGGGYLAVRPVYLGTYEEDLLLGKRPVSQQGGGALSESASGLRIHCPSFIV